MVLACSSFALNIGTVEYGTSVVGATTSANTPILKLTLTIASGPGFARPHYRSEISSTACGFQNSSVAVDLGF
jgi:hypothetical protein